MAAPRPTFRTAVIPPDVPAIPDMSPKLSDYLRRFALWCREGFADKLSGTVAQPGILLQACDAPAGTTPKVFLIQVKSDGTLVATPAPLGEGWP